MFGLHCVDLRQSIQILLNQLRKKRDNTIKISYYKFSQYFKMFKF